MEKPILNLSDVRIPLDAFVEQIATKAAWVVIDKHINNCGIKSLEDRLRSLENRFAVLLGAIVGAGALAGAVGAAVQKLLGG